MRREAATMSDRPSETPTAAGRPAGAPNTRRRVVLVGLFVLLLGVVGGAVFAQQQVSPIDLEAAAAAETTAQTGSASAVVWFYGIALAVGVGLAVIYAVARRRQKRAFASDGPGYTMTAWVERADTSPTEQRALGGGGASDSILESTSSDDADAGLHLVGGDEADRRCPECRRTFPATIVICPYDSSPLRAAPEPDQRAGRGDAGPLARLMCGGCDRRYEPGVEYCYHDGLPLVADTEDLADKAPRFKACETCGWEGQSSDEAVCPNDGSDLVTVDVSDQETLAPTIPLLVCPQCRQFAPPGKAFCPHDGELLTPLTSVRMTTFPDRGFGPKRKLCQTCGTQYSGAARYCCNDGTKLIDLN